VDINRNFPTKNWELGERDKYFGGTSPSSEIETKFLVKVLEDYNPILILTLHTPYKVVNYDGPAKEVAELISKIMNYPVEESIGYPTPGSFGTYAGIEKNLPVITLELDEEISVEALYPNVKEVFNQVIR
jgi:protein MpaA